MKVYQTTKRDFLYSLQSTMTALTATKNWSPSHLRTLHPSWATNPAFHLSGAVHASCFDIISQRTLLKTEHRTALYRTAGDFVTDVSCREHLQIKFWVEVMSLLRVHPVSLHGNCGWSGKPKKSVLICKRKQMRQADVYLVYCSWSLF